jgi:hypothetical protein
MFIPNCHVFRNILDKYDFSKNDMENFSIIQSQTGLIENLPIFISDPLGSPEYQFVTNGFDKFQIIFDAAAMGQYLGGVDPRNIPGDTRGFVNETCIIKYDQYRFIWKTSENIKRPFIVAKDSSDTDFICPIFNLHIHSKNLENFI